MHNQRNPLGGTSTQPFASKREFIAALRRTEADQRGYPLTDLIVRFTLSDLSTWPDQQFMARVQSTHETPAQEHDRLQSETAALRRQREAWLAHT